MQAIWQGDEPKARRIAARYARLRRDDPYAWFICSIVETRFGDEKTNEAVLREGLRRHPHSTILLCEMASLYASTDRSEEAEELARQALNGDPGSPNPYIALSHLAAMRLDWPDLDRHAEAAEARLSASDNHMAVLELASLLMWWPQGRARAERLLASVTRYAPWDPWGHLWRGVLLENSDPVGAQKHLAEARKLWPESQDEFEELLEKTKRITAGPKPP